MSSTSYQVGETVDITLRGATIRDVGNNFLDIKTADGDEMCIVFPTAEGVEITRRGPAGGVQPSDVWEDSRGNTWFAILHEHRYGADVVKLTRDGLTTYPVEMVHKDYVLVKRLFRAEPKLDHGLSESAAAELEALSEPGQVEPEPALGKKVRLDGLVDQIEDETPLHVIHPDWNDGQPVRLREVSLWGDDIPFGDIGVRYSYVDRDGDEHHRGAYVSAATLVIPCGSSPA